MKLIATNPDTKRLTLEVTYSQLRDLRWLIGDAITHLEAEPGKLRDLLAECEGEDSERIAEIIYDAGRAEETVESLEKALAYAERFLPVACEHADEMMRIMGEVPGFW